VQNHFKSLTVLVIDAFVIASSRDRGGVNPEPPFNNNIPLFKKKNFDPARDVGHVIIGFARNCRPAEHCHCDIADIDYFDVDEKLMKTSRFTNQVVNVY